MGKFTHTKYRLRLSTVLVAATLTTLVAFEVSCNKSTSSTTQTTAATPRTTPVPVASAGKSGSHQALTSVVTIAMLRPSSDGRILRAMFNENEQILNVVDEAAIAALKDAYSKNKAVQITFDPWAAQVIKVSEAQGQATATPKPANNMRGVTKKVNLATDLPESYDNPSMMGMINTTDPGLTPVIPDMQTAQMMFDYIAHQCCQLPGPYTIDHCLTFQYCPDGCYARAHKMCWIINNRYKYATQKIFSFANAGSDELCVKAEKWGGCCINWWYHVAPLVTIKTPSGPKAYVFDPAMFDQPVLLSAWLHAQENPACVPPGDVPHVTMINIQPTTSYWPSGSSGLTFDTDPAYSSTNSTLVSYQHLISCP